VGDGVRGGNFLIRNFVLVIQIIDYYRSYLNAAIKEWRSSTKKNGFKYGSLRIHLHFHTSYNFRIFFRMPFNFPISSNLLCLPNFLISFELNSFRITFELSKPFKLGFENLLKYFISQDNHYVDVFG
jgi:hypothetical protein